MDRTLSTCDNCTMVHVKQLVKHLCSPSEHAYLQGVTVRSYADKDMQTWLDLRHAAFAKERVGVRKWVEADFVIEFLQHWWWQPSRMWIAEESCDGKAPRVIGSVTLAMRGDPSSAKPVVHWLMVRPDWRRRGLGRLLMAHLEAAAWNAGYRQLWLETHAGWQAAAHFYEALGYLPAAT